MSTLRLKIYNRDLSDWRYQVVNGSGAVVTERRFLPDRASAERIGEHKRRALVAAARHAETAARLRAQAY